MKAQPERPLYLDVADKVARLIVGGVLRPGEKLPSLRRLSEQHHVSLATAIQAYIQLEDRGLVEARRRSGFFVRTRQPITILSQPRVSKPPSAASPVTVGSLQSRLFEAVMMPDVIPLGGAVPGAGMLPMAKLNRLLAAQSRLNSTRGVSYDMPPGCEPLRRQIVKRALDAGVTLLPDEVIVTNGATEALMLCLRAVAPPGSVVAVESPTYFGILHALEELGLKAVEIPMHPRHGMDLDVLEKTLATRPVSACLAVPTFSNPVGALMPDEHKRRLVAMLSSREVPLIEDDVFGELPFSHERPRAAKAFDSKGLVMLCGSFSKSLAPGYRVGWVAPGKHYERVRALKLTSTLANASLPSFAVAGFLANGGYDHYLRSARAAYSANMQRMTAAIAESFPPGTKVTQPEGGFLLWVELPKRVDALDLHELALTRKISIAPGPMFSATQGYRNFIRISCGEAWTARIAEAVKTLGKLCMKQ